MSEDIDRKMMCAGEKPEGPPEKPPVEKATRKGPYPAVEPPDPWPEPEPPKPDKRGKNQE